MPALVHVAAAVVWLVALLEVVGARYLLGDGEVLLRTRDLVAAAGGAVVVGLCLSGVRRPIWPAVALAAVGTLAVLVLHLAAGEGEERVAFAFVAGSAYGEGTLVVALLLGLAVGLLAPAAVRRRG